MSKSLIYVPALTEGEKVIIPEVWMEKNLQYIAKHGRAISAQQ